MGRRPYLPHGPGGGAGKGGARWTLFQDEPRVQVSGSEHDEAAEMSTSERCQDGGAAGTRGGGIGGLAGGVGIEYG